MTGHIGDRTLSALTTAAAIALAALTIPAVIGLATPPAWQTLAALTAAWTCVLVVSLVRRQQAAPSDTAVPDAAPHQVLAENLGSTASAELLQFANEVYAELQSDRLRALIARRLPDLLGLGDVWVVAQFGNRRFVITPTGTTGEDGHPAPVLTREEKEWATFPMKVDREAVGILGVGLPVHRFSSRDRLLLSTVASILGRALKVSDTFEALREMSIIDPLTGCLLRPEGMRRLDAELRRAQRSSRPLALLLLDLDHFKSVNDRLGHHCGDAVLTAVGGIMMRTLRASDLRCRWGGEEFLIILPESSAEPAKRVAESLRRYIADLRVTCGAHTATTTASIGIAIAPPGELDARRLVSRADTALYQAKHAGRNCVRLVLEDSPASQDTPAQGAWTATVPSEGSAQWQKAAPDGSFTDRRDPSRTDRRRFPSPGRRRTDPGVVDGPWMRSS